MLSIGEKKLIKLKENNEWLDFRLNEMEIGHKHVVFELCKNVPSIVDHLKSILEKIEVDANTYVTYWKVTEEEGKLLLLMALPRESDEFEYTDVSLLCDASGNLVKKDIKENV
jgi:hypothetical protein